MFQYDFISFESDFEEVTSSYMSPTLKQVGNFLQLLLSTTKLQAHALLDTLDRKQVQAIREILFNILHKNIEHTTLQSPIIKKRTLVLSRIIKSTGAKAGNLIAKHYRTVHHTLLMFKDYILHIL